ncbi:hypothetical protein C8R44DRAFT_867339 [Mycena epipterygia]|nr:hypothetical protein C8R44DRAFT_867339 [Mycena epipterygia]
MRNSPLLMSSTAMTIADTSVGGPEAHTCLAPKNWPAQAPQGARLRVECAPWVVLMRMDLAIPMLPRMVMDVGGKMAMRVGTSARVGTVIGREGSGTVHAHAWTPPHPPRACQRRATRAPALINVYIWVRVHVRIPDTECMGVARGGEGKPREVG